MAKAFSIRDFLNDAWQQDPGPDVYERVSIHDIGLNPENRYAMSEIEKLKDSIYALGGVQQNIVLARCPEGAGHKYLALDGHRRLAACRELVAEGYGEFEYVPAVIKGQADPDTENAVPVLMNSTQRNKTDWEKVMEHMRLKEIIPKLKKRHGMDGRSRDIEADMLGVSRGQVNIYNTIGTRLCKGLMDEFREGNIGISVAYGAARLGPGRQQELVDMFLGRGVLTEDDVSRVAGSSTVEGQMASGLEGDINVPESGTPGKAGQEPAGALAGTGKNVPESGTSEKTRQEPAGALAGTGKNVPESGTFEKKQREPAGILAADSAGVPKPYMPAGQAAGGGRESRMPGPDTAGTWPAVSAGADMGKGHAAAPRGGYGVEMVEHQIRKYSGYLDVLTRKGGQPHGMVTEYNCILDALDLLKERFMA